MMGVACRGAGAPRLGLEVTLPEQQAAGGAPAAALPAAPQDWVALVGRLCAALAVQVAVLAYFAPVSPMSHPMVHCLI